MFPNVEAYRLRRISFVKERDSHGRLADRFLNAPYNTFQKLFYLYVYL